MYRYYDVDAGVIGVVPLELVKEDMSPYCGHKFMFAGKCHFQSRNGKFFIEFENGTSLQINTRDDDDEFDDDEDDDDEE